MKERDRDSACMQHREKRGCRRQTECACACVVLTSDPESSAFHWRLIDGRLKRPAMSTTSYGMEGPRLGMAWLLRLMKEVTSMELPLPVDFLTSLRDFPRWPTFEAVPMDFSSSLIDFDSAASNGTVPPESVDLSNLSVVAVRQWT